VADAAAGLGIFMLSIPDSRGRAVAESHLMTTQPEWPRIAVVGAGAVGGYFVGMLSRAGAPVAMIGRQTFADAVKRNGLFLDTPNSELTLNSPWRRRMDRCELV